MELQDGLSEAKESGQEALSDAELIEAELNDLTPIPPPATLRLALLAQCKLLRQSLPGVCRVQMYCYWSKQQGWVAQAVKSSTLIKYRSWVRVPPQPPMRA